MIKAVAMLSGGLDSILAARIVLEQGVELYAINFMTVFCTCTHKGSSCLASEGAARQLGIPLKVVNISHEYMEIVRRPAHGYGSNLNPCLDCRIFTFKKAKQYMEELGARFIVTGEVLGERPMSQRRDALNLIEKEAGLKGLVLRPLSAQHFEPTVAEKEGWVDRTKLLDIKGRSRKPQIALAKEFDIHDYPCPSGGCLLTDPGYSRRVRDLLEHGALTVSECILAKIGRHFRLNETTKAVVGRNEQENEKLLHLAADGDIILDVKNTPSPVTLLRGGHNNNGVLELAAALTAGYSKAKDQSRASVLYWKHPQDQKQEIEVTPQHGYAQGHIG